MFSRTLGHIIAFKLTGLGLTHGLIQVCRMFSISFLCQLTMSLTNILWKTLIVNDRIGRASKHPQEHVISASDRHATSISRKASAIWIMTWSAHSNIQLGSNVINISRFQGKTARISQLASCSRWNWSIPVNCSLLSTEITASLVRNKHLSCRTWARRRVSKHRYPSFYRQWIWEFEFEPACQSDFQRPDVHPKSP